MLREILLREKLILFVVIPTLAMTNLLLLRQNVQLRGMIFKDHSHLDLLQSGDQAAPFQALLLEGKQIQVGFSPQGRKWVLLYFSSRCRFSYQQFPYWRGLIERGKASNLKVLGLVSEHEDPEQVRAFLKSVDAASLPVARIPDSVHRRYKLLIAPLTLTVNGQGRVERNWVGRWGFRAMQEASELLQPDPSPSRSESMRQGF